MLQVLKPESTDTVLTLTSGGCNALNLLLHGAGHVRTLSAPQSSDWALWPVVLKLSKCCQSKDVPCCTCDPHAVSINQSLADCADLQVVAVDCNPAQSALLELKATAIRCAFSPSWLIKDFRKYFAVICFQVPAVLH